METPVGLRTFDYRSDRDGPVEAPNWSSLLGGALTNAGSIFDMLAPALRLGGSYYAGQRSADRMEEAARSYRELGREAAGMADPWGNDRRRQFQGKLDELLADPTKSPIYQSMERRAMQALGPRLAAEGRAGSDAGSRDWLETLGDVSNKYTGEWADRFGRWGGADIDPSRAAQFMMEGGRLEQDALTAAMAARLAPLGTFTGGNTNGGSQGGLSSLLRQLGQSLGGNQGGNQVTPALIQQLMRQFGGQDSGASMQNLIGMARMFGISPSSLAGLWSGAPSIPGLEETWGNPGSGDWTFGDGSYPWEVTGNTYEPNYGSWWEGGDDVGDFGDWSGEITFEPDDIWNIFGFDFGR